MKFADRLCHAVKERKTPVIVGLDPRRQNLPKSIQPKDNSVSAQAQAFRQFCLEVIDAIAGLVPAVKPNAAFFEALGPEGMEVLRDVNEHANKNGLLVVLDAKRGDIGSTAQAYANAFLRKNNLWFSDALTVNPYLGSDTIEPFVKVAHENDCGIFVLVKTSNPGSADFQNITEDSRSIYQRVADAVTVFNRTTLGLSGYGACGSVVGATYPEQIAELRERMPDSIFLIPGVGAQGGKASEVAAAFDHRGFGALINSSRGIIFAYENEKYSAMTNWQDAVRRSAEELIEQVASETPAGELLDKTENSV